ncbi:hypothetical protein RRG08_035585 [Elysia crispata]|uniref:Uncharacterized protein n=1 Tax=Elysia crispata TaxID=231223 RepID=A0AAE1B6Q9_9GAST|nr:hypothetical protein RRG08_035585 [Elysia crispata]
MESQPKRIFARCITRRLSKRIEVKIWNKNIHTSQMLTGDQDGCPFGVRTRMFFAQHIEQRKCEVHMFCFDAIQSKINVQSVNTTSFLAKFASNVNKDLESLKQVPLMKSVFPRQVSDLPVAQWCLAMSILMLTQSMYLVTVKYSDVQKLIDVRDVRTHPLPLILIIAVLVYSKKVSRRFTVYKQKLYRLYEETSKDRENATIDEYRRIIVDFNLAFRKPYKKTKVKSAQPTEITPLRKRKNYMWNT